MSTPPLAETLTSTEANIPTGPTETLTPTETNTATLPSSEPHTETVGEKRKREGEGEQKVDPSQHPLYKTSLCSYFRKHSTCVHGDACRYAHGEEELRLRPDNSWDPTSDRAKKALKLTENEEEKEKEEEEGIMMTDFVSGDGEGNGGCLDSGLSKCLIHLPRKWGSDQFRGFLNDLGIVFKSAKKKKGMTVGFVSFECTDQLNTAVEELEGKAAGNKKIKVADVVPRAYDDKIKSAMACPLGSGSGGDANGLDGENEEVSKSMDVEAKAKDEGSSVRGKSARDVVTPLAYLTYSEQLEQKKNSVMQMLKKLTRNARKACPNGVSLPEWILKSREIGGLPCNLEGILESPLINGYRNKCEFSVGYSLQGKPTVGFLLGNFREGVTAVEEPLDCPNVSIVACKYATIFQEFLQQSCLPIWNRFKNVGFWRQLTVREGRVPGKAPDVENPVANIAEVMLIVQVSSVGFDNMLISSELGRLADAFVARAAANSPPLPLTHLVVQDHQGISNVAPADSPLRILPLSNADNGSETETIGNIAEARIRDYISNLRFSISPTAFFQVNSLAAEKLYSLAGDWANLGPETLLFDVCCGTGTIGLTLAHRVGMVVGIEMNASAVEDAKQNAEINGIKNCRFVAAKAEDVMGSLLNEYLSTTHVQDEVPNSSENGDKHVNSVEKNDTHEDDKKGMDDAHEDDKKGMDDAHEDDKKGMDEKPVSLHKNGEDVAQDPQNCGKEVQIHVQETSASEGESLSAGQFKNVVAIVDPPRAVVAVTGDQNQQTAVNYKLFGCNHRHLGTLGNCDKVIKALRTHSSLRRVVYISCNPETLVANAIELCTPSPETIQKGNKDNRGWRRMSSAGLARHRAKSMPASEPFRPMKAMAVDLFPHTAHCEMVMLLER